MPATFICQSAEPKDGAKSVLLALDREVPNYLLAAVTPDVLSEMGAEAVTPGDEVDVQFIVRPRGGNGMQQR